jgi:hypothetical protein
MPGLSIVYPYYIYYDESTVLLFVKYYYGSQVDMFDMGL